MRSLLETPLVDAILVPTWRQEAANRLQLGTKFCPRCSDVGPEWATEVTVSKTPRGSRDKDGKTLSKSCQKKATSETSILTGGRPYNQLLLQATRRGAKSFFRYFVLVLHRKRKVTEGVAHSFCSKSPYSLRVALADFAKQQQNMLLSMSRSICSNLYCCVLPCTTPYYSVLLCTTLHYTTLLCTSL